jgi:hypothetical protein
MFGLKGTAPSMIKEYNAIGLRAHNGIDFQVACADNQVHHGGKCEEAFCSIIGVDLTVISVSRDERDGYGVNLQDQFGNRYCYWHFDVLDPLMFVGNKVTFGQRLGISGNTGMSTGAHVHFGYYPLSGGEAGYGGAGDPEPYFDNRFCLDIKSRIAIIQKLLEIYKAIYNILKK